jgi:hypothetical protein
VSDRTSTNTVERDTTLDGLADMVADLLQDNLNRLPDRARLLEGRPWAAQIDVYDTESSFVVDITGRTVRVRESMSGPKALHIRADGETLVELPEVPLLAGLPDLRQATGRQLLSKLARRQLQIRGLLRHPLRLSRLLRLLNTADTY